MENVAVHCQKGRIPAESGSPLGAGKTKKIVEKCKENRTQIEWVFWVLFSSVFQAPKLRFPAICNGFAGLDNFSEVEKRR